MKKGEKRGTDGRQGKRENGKSEKRDIEVIGTEDTGGVKREKGE